MSDTGGTVLPVNKSIIEVRELDCHKRGIGPWVCKMTTKEMIDSGTLIIDYSFSARDLDLRNVEYMRNANPMLDSEKDETIHVNFIKPSICKLVEYEKDYKILQCG